MSVNSMTAFAHQQGRFDWANVVWELRSVNQRYLDLTIRLPEQWRHLEGPLRERCRKKLKRGKLECNLNIEAGLREASLTLDTKLAAEVAKAAESAAGLLANPAAVDPLALLQWPGVLRGEEADLDQMETDILSLFQQTLETLVEGRLREGGELKSLILQRTDSIAEVTASVRESLPDIVAAQQQRLQQKMAALQVELDPARLEAEIVLMAQKADVAEELDRLDTHVTEVRRILDAGGSCGRQLDFLMQELNREANTLASKAIVSDTTQNAVQLKVLIEQMREQIQNIE